MFDNAAYIRLSSAKLLDSTEVCPVIVFNHDPKGRIFANELLDVEAKLPPVCWRRRDDTLIMVQRAYLTEHFVDSLIAPEGGELWIADTAIKGFGIRLWRHNGRASLAFAIRVVDRNGKSIRRTFNPYGDLNIYWRLSGMEMNEDGSVRKSALLEDARRWAATEIKRLKGFLPTLAELRTAEHEHEAMLDRAGAHLSSKTLGQLVELVLGARRARGWTEEYCDRLRRAFDKFDPNDAIRVRTIEDLSDGSLRTLIRDSGISPGNGRLLRSLLNVVLWNVHDLGGPAIGRLLPDRRHLQPAERPAKGEEFIASISPADIAKLYSVLQSLPFDWRPRECVKACLLFRQVPSRVMKGRWSQIVDDTWFPYSPEERRSWYWRSDRIKPDHLACLRRARDAAREEAVVSDFWFPSRGAHNRPIANVDRTWFALLDEMGWPHLSLSRASKLIHERFFLWSGVTFARFPDNSTRQSVRHELASWGLTVSDPS